MSEKKEVSSDFPRPGSAMYNIYSDDEEIRRKSLKKWRRYNKYLTLPLYKIRLLPLLGFGRIFLVITTLGRNSGKKRNTPLEYHWIDDVITIFSSRGENSDWMKNIRKNPDSVWVRHGFHHFHAKVEIIDTFDGKKYYMQWYVEVHPKAAKMLFGWDKDNDDVESEYFSKVVNSLTIVRLHKRDED